MTTRVLAAVALIALVAGARSASAQAVERPVPFDSAGRIMVITPSAAAQLALTPPAWRVTGEFIDARLFALGDSSFVLVVNRPGGVVERYALTLEERNYLRGRVVELHGIPRLGTIEDRGGRSRFIAQQTLLGLMVYAPAFSTAITHDAAGRSSAYLLVAGGTFFAASELSRSIPIAPSQASLSTRTALHGAWAGWGLAYALNGNTEAQAAAAFAGGLAGTAAGLRLGENMSSGQVTATSTGVGLLAGLSYVAAVANGPTDGTTRDVLTHGEALGVVGASLLGYPLSSWYVNRAPYNVTSGDVYTMWLTGIIGLGAASIPIVDSDIHSDPASGILSAGFLAGMVAGDRLLVRRYDHTAGEAEVLTLGTAAGALMGSGVGTLVQRHGSDTFVATTLTLGAVGGLVLTERFIIPRVDEGRPTRLSFNPVGAVLAATRRPGTHSMLTWTF